MLQGVMLSREKPSMVPIKPQSPSLLHLTLSLLTVVFTLVPTVTSHPLPVLRQELIDRYGLPRFADVNDRRVVFSSPLVDVAANLPTARQTVEACRLILENTPWPFLILD